MKKRNEAVIETTWRLEDMIPDRETWERLFTEVSQEMTSYSRFKGRLGESAEGLYDCLSFDDAFSRKAELLYVYARMRSDEDTANQEYQEMSGRAQTRNLFAR